MQPPLYGSEWKRDEIGDALKLPFLDITQVRYRLERFRKLFQRHARLRPLCCPFERRVRMDALGMFREQRIQLALLGRHQTRIASGYALRSMPRDCQQPGTELRRIGKLRESPKRQQ